MTMDTIRHSNRGQLQILGRNNAVRWAIRLSRRDDARERLARMRRRHSLIHKLTSYARSQAFRSAL